MKDNPGFRANNRIDPHTRSVTVSRCNNASMFLEGREHPYFPQETITLDGMTQLFSRITGMRCKVDQAGEDTYLIHAN